MVSIIDVISLIKRSTQTMRAAERKVADLVLEDLNFAAGATISEIARRAEVSEPSITRFCKTIGFEGIRDFKIALAQNLAVGTRFMAEAVGRDDSVELLADKIFDGIKQSLDRTREVLNTAAIAAAADILEKASNIVIFGSGGRSGGVACDTFLRFFRLGTPASYHTDGELQHISAASCPEGSVILAISSTGRIASLNEAVQIAHHYGIPVIAIAPTASPISKYADVLIPLDTPDHADIFRPSSIRQSQLAIIDILATGYALHLSEKTAETLRRVKLQTDPGMLLHCQWNED